MDAILRQSLRDFRDERIASGKAMTPAERKRKRKLFNKIAASEGRRDVEPMTRRDLPFLGIDGEGAGTDDIGRQHYLLLSAGNGEMHKELFDANNPLTTLQCLNFICNLPKKAIIVGFAFNYDVTMILRDLPADKRALLFQSDEERERAGRKSRYVYFRDYALEYRPSQYFRVARIKNQKIVVGSSRTVFETWGFFQASFVNALIDFEIAKEDLAFIQEKKKEREGFTAIDDEIRLYCKTECRWLADLMEKFRQLCFDGGIEPRTWNGAGKLAKALHTKYKTPKRKDLPHIPDDLWQIAQRSYYGGRFEIMRTGYIDGPVYEADICSAYPAAMLKLPCLREGHGEWTQGKFDKQALFSIAKVKFEHRLKDGNKRSLNICGLPVRTHKGVLTWPSRGIGVYWNVELNAAEKLGMTYKVIDKTNAWTYKKTCNCHPFAWVEDLYNYRLSVGKAIKGKPIKLGINALYGALAQRIGNGPWQNYIWASLITALTRAKLIDAASHAPDSIIMFATDGIYSTQPLSIIEGDKLGQWEIKECPHMFIVQPGFYWGAKKPKRRGIPQKFFEPYVTKFEQAWSDYRENISARVKGAGFPDYPAINIKMTRFVGLRQAQSWNRPEKAGMWEKTDRDISFDWTNKRRHVDYEIIGNSVKHYPLLTEAVETKYYDWTADTKTLAGELAMDMEACPDYVDTSIPFD